SWGNTLTAVSEQLIPCDKKNIKIVQLNGGIAKNIIPTKGELIIQNFSENYNATGYILPVPSFVDNSGIAKAIKQDSKINEVFELM
ncbi:hypothetical protein J9303_19300, partial [Bacillaceae bacterium Marseille-Q3522]|nr:hypothetical protein [Bacillaceae bacterium Marseille-Q3522]